MSTYEPDEALVLAAGKALQGLSDKVWRKHPGDVPTYLEQAEAVLRAVGPTLLARGWDEGHHTGGEVCDCPNPHDGGAS